MKRTLVLALVCALGTIALANVPQESGSFANRFFPLKAGTYWIYEGTVRWYDFEKDEPATEKISWRMSVDKVIQRKGLTAAVVTGFPADLDWSGGAAEPKQWLFLETNQHQVHYVNLGPNFDLTKYEKGEQGFEKFLVPDTMLLEWPPKPGAKFCAAEDQKREDRMYCWFAAGQEKRKLDNVKGSPAEEQTVYELKYMSNPDDIRMELVAGVGLISYQYHHHGTVADTELQLVEFHAAEEPATKP